MSKASVHGYIEIELIKKHGQRLVFHENILTQFGKSFVMSNGLAGMFGAGTTKSSNKIRCNGTRSYLSYGTDNTNPVGPYLLNGNGTEYTDGSKITNLLLTNPTLAVDKALYIPNSDTLAGYAVADSSASGTLKEGTVAQLKDSQDRARKIVRRFEYASDLACEFNCIAMSTINTTGTTGRIVPMYRSIQPLVYNYSTMSYYTLNRVGLGKLKDGLLTFKAANNVVYTVSGTTGVIEEGGTVNEEFAKQQIISVFTYGDYTYVITTLAGSYSRTSRVGYYVLNTAGEVVQTYTFTVSNYSYDKSYGMIYYDNTFYFVDCSEQFTGGGANGYEYTGYWYPLTENSVSGILEFNASTRISFKKQIPYGMHSVIGSDTAGFTNLAIGVTGNTSTYWYLEPTGFWLVDADFNKIGSETAYTGCLFNIGNQVLSLAKCEQYAQDWADKLEGLVEYGNLLSYHMLEQPIQKNVGDVMYVTYSYTID